MTTNPGLDVHRHPKLDRPRWRTASIVSFAALLGIIAISSNLFPSPSSRHNPSRTIRSRSSLDFYGVLVSPNNLPFSTEYSLSRIVQNDQWKTRRKDHDHDKKYFQGNGHRHRYLKYNKTEWEDDDDDDVMPFHLEDDDATKTTNSNAADAIINDSENGNNIEDAKSNKPKPKEKKKAKKKNSNKDKGIIYSGDVGAKESHKKIPPPPPPPPPPTAENSEKGIMEKETNVTKKGNEKKGEKKEDSAHTHLFGNTTHKHNQTNSTQSSSTQIPNDAEDKNDDDSILEDDTILDDLARGFTFAALFCTALLLLHKCCYHTCVRCGFFPDERVLEARWRRWQLKKKRAYRRIKNYDVDDDVPPLDTREWAQWMLKRADMRGDDGFYYSGIGSGGSMGDGIGIGGGGGGGGGVWDPLTNDLEQDRSEWAQEEDSIGSRSSLGFVEIHNDNGAVEMAVWEYNKHNNLRGGGNGDRDDDASSMTEDMVLEYGEGDELEDASHDSRMFDEEDGGKGLKSEAKKFFKGRNNHGGDRKKDERRKGKEEKNGSKDNGSCGYSIISGGSSNGSGANSTKDDAASNREVLTKNAEQRSDTSDDDDSFFDALQPPSGGNDPTPLLDSLPTYNTPSSSAKDSANENPRVPTDHLDDQSNNDQQTTQEDTTTLLTDTSKDDDDTTGNTSIQHHTGGFRNSMILAGDRGYDEETDLLGLRSDSPPPLDLEEIEKNIIKNMEKDKFY